MQYKNREAEYFSKGHDNVNKNIIFQRYITENGEKLVIQAGNLEKCISMFLPYIDVDEYNKVLKKAVSLSEQLTLQLRSMPTKDENMQFTYQVVQDDDLKDNTDFLFDIDQSLIRIKCLRMLPHRKKNNSYFYNNMYTQLSHAVKGKQYERMDKATVVFIHHYPKEEYGVRDYDNYETKAALDILNSFFLNGDNPKNIHVLHISCFSGEDVFTEILLMPQQNFRSFMDEYYEKFIS